MDPLLIQLIRVNDPLSIYSNQRPQQLIVRTSLMKRLFFPILIGLIFGFFPILNLSAIQLIFKDNKGHYHYRCTDKTGGKTVVVYRSEGVFVDGPTGQDFYPADSATIKRSEASIKITEKYARIGCRERLGNAQ